MGCNCARSARLSRAATRKATAKANRLAAAGVKVKKASPKKAAPKTAAPKKAKPCNCT